ncbi:MAG: hypothetical protein HY807_08320 [Nitrospirae bacterium]|nr:hypothetical protein [Nitrospirota bacterium]
MTLSKIVRIVSNKEKFLTLKDYIEFCKLYLEFATAGLQAVIVSQNENHYRFYQYKKDGHFNITRPINSNLMYEFPDIPKIEKDFFKILNSVRDIPADDKRNRELIKRGIYTIQQSIGAALDALPAGASNKARKVNGDLFERFIQLLIKEIGVKCKTGTVQVPVYIKNEFQFNMSYQHDLLLYKDETLKVIGSVKTSSKDRIDKIFLDKFLYCKLTNTMLPHIAIFLNDVQRKNSKRQDEYGINATFLPGHFKAFTVKLNPLDGVYYCDIRPNMEIDDLLKKHIRTIDHFFCSDIWSFIES